MKIFKEWIVTDMEEVSLYSVYVGGMLTLLMAVFHTQFFRLFRWKTEYSKLSGLNSRIFYTIHLALMFLFFLTGILIIFYAREISGSQGLALGLNLILSLFWLWRSVWQIIYFKGKLMHYLLIICFMLLFISFLIPLAGRYI